MTNKKLRRAKELELEISQLKSTLEIISNKEGSLVFLVGGTQYTTWYNIPDSIKKEIREFAYKTASEKLTFLENEFKEL